MFSLLSVEQMKNYLLISSKVKSICSYMKNEVKHITFITPTTEYVWHKLMKIICNFGIFSVGCVPVSYVITFNESNLNQLFV